MRALIVVESQFGNTAAIAERVAVGLRTGAEVVVRPITESAEDLGDYQLLVVGGPTHALGLSRPATRADARGRGGGQVAGESGLREWIERLEPVTGLRHAAAFDTKIARPRVPGSAARAAHRRLRRLGFTAAAAPMTFFVEDVEGPLVPGELERAEAWGAQLLKSTAAVRM